MKQAFLRRQNFLAYLICPFHGIATPRLPPIPLSTRRGGHGGPLAAGCMPPVPRRERSESNQTETSGCALAQSNSGCDALIPTGPSFWPLISPGPIRCPLIPTAGPIQRTFASDAAPPINSEHAQIFDEHLKALQRERALWAQPRTAAVEEARAPSPLGLEDPLVESITETLLDRLEDCKSKFPRALVLGGVFGNVIAQLRGRGGIEQVTVLDTSQALLESTKKALESRDDLPPTIDYVAYEPGQILPVEAESFDAVIACLGLHWHNDLPGLLLQCRFALKPDGFFLGALFGGDTLQEMRISCTLAELEREGGVSPRTSPLAQVRDAGNLLTRAGLNLTTVDVDALSVQYPTAVEVVEHLRCLGETNASRARNPVLSRDSALASAAIYQHIFQAGNEAEGSGSAVEAVTATFQVIFLSGWAPHSSQQTAKARGSATASFDDLQRVVKERRNKD